MELLRKKSRVSATVAIIVSTVTITFIIICFVALPESFPWNSILSAARPKLVGVSLAGSNDGSATTSPNPAVPSKTARALIDSIKEARRLASGKSENELASDGNETEENELEEWKRKNPCMSRVELLPMYDKRKHAKKLPPNPLWEELLAEYSKLHRTCLKRVGNLTDYFVTGNVSVAGCQFLVADVAGWTGLGNKIYVTASSLLYAIVTRRVVLIPSGTLLPAYTCEPFLGSSWVLDSQTFPVPRIYNVKDFENSQWTHNEQFFKEIDDVMENLTDAKTRENIQKGLMVPAERLENAVGVITSEWQPNNRFYCTVEQAFYSQLPWVYMSGCIYTVPKLSATPSFRPIMEELFPDKMVMTRLLRSLILPADGVWGRVRRINHAYIADAERRVGVQVRYKDGTNHYNRMNSLVNERILACTRKFGILPDVNSSKIVDSNLSPQNLSSPTPMVKVFVASLFTGLFDHLSRIFVRFPSVDGEEVGLVQVSQDAAQKLDDVEEDKQALTEMLLLSLSDQLVVTPVSTFGGTAQAYGALTPWFVEMRENRDLPPCERAQTVDACDQFADMKYKCPYDHAVDKRLFSDVVPYIKDCLTIDHPDGIQLITDFQS